MISWVECVPNFSEGRERSVIERISNAIESTPDTRLLHIDPGLDANRTVITFAARPDTAVEAGFRAIATAAELIDMRRHSGAHRRIGATDVFPFVPLENTTFDMCIELAKKLASRVAEELRIPVYLYGKAAAHPNRTQIPNIRKGGYEALRQRITRPDFKPDFGDVHLPPKQGATIIGVRDFLVAYNINLGTMSVASAKSIARAVRESGVPVRDSRGRLVRNAKGEIERTPGQLKAVQADGWLMPSYGVAQVTMNLLDFHQTGLHTAFEAVKGEAEKLGIGLDGSEIIGLVPKAAILEAGKYYLERQTTDTMDEEKLIVAAIDHLGLSAVKTFRPASKIVEMVLN